MRSNHAARYLSWCETCSPAERLGREAEEQAFMNSPHLDIEERFGREVRALRYTC